MSNEALSIALSGGGTRAMAYHAGVLKFLAENNYLEKVGEISTVSGGSLLVGLIYSENELSWPDSETFKARTFPAIQMRLTSSCLQSRLSRDFLLKPSNWRFLFSRGNILASGIESLWNVSGLLGSIHNGPIWSINGTTAETGKRFRFKEGKAGDSSLGYFDARNFKIAKAIAISAAYPLIGGFSLKPHDYVWYKRKAWGDPEGSEVFTVPVYQKLYLTDGGVYDNLGSESSFDHGIFRPRIANRSVLISDAGATLNTTPKYLELTIVNLIRALSISMEQARALRVRGLMNYFNKENKAGLVGIGSKPEVLTSESRISGDSWQKESQRLVAMNYPTNLKKMSESDFRTISEHGYELMEALFLKNERELL